MRLPLVVVMLCACGDDGDPLTVQLDSGPIHTAELPFVFDTSDVFPLGKIDAPALIDDVQSHWIEFATFGHPGVQWPAYDAATDAYLVFDVPTSQGTQLRTGLCDFWDTL